MNFDNLHQILRSLYEQMMPLCGDMAGVAKGIAGLGALFYVAYRVWQSLARAEPIDVFPMLRPFAIGLCIMFFPTVVLGTMNGIMSPVVQGTAKMLEAETLDMNTYRQQKDKLEYEAMMRNPENPAYLVSNEEFDKQLEELGLVARRHGDDGGDVYRARDVQHEKGHPRLLPRDTGTDVPSRRPRDRHHPHVLPRGAGAYSVR